MIWPSNLINLSREYIKYEKGGEDYKHIRKNIEDSLSKKWRTNCLLMPSARASLSLIFRHLKLNRNHIIYTEKYVSHCVWDIISRYSNPTCIYPNKADVVVAIHQYGKKNKMSGLESKILIEDSCDANIRNGSEIYPNGGKYSIMSIPKIGGLWSGGILSVRKRHEANEIRKLRECTKHDELTEIQGERKYLRGMGKIDSSTEWMHNEYQNMHIDRTSLHFMVNNLEKQIELNHEVIQRRVNEIKYISGFEEDMENIEKTGWMPPAITLRKEKMINELLMERYINVGNNKGKYEKCQILPIHFGIKDNEFDRLLEKIKKFHVL